jgi:hypothetical protein
MHGMSRRNYDLVDKLNRLKGAIVHDLKLYVVMYNEITPVILSTTVCTTSYICISTCVQ